MKWESLQYSICFSMGSAEALKNKDTFGVKMDKSEIM